MPLYLGETNYAHRTTNTGLFTANNHLYWSLPFNLKQG